MGEAKVSFFIITILLLIVFLGLTLTVFKLTGLGFIVEVAVLLAIILIGFISLIPAYEDANAGWGFLAAVMAIVLADLLVIVLRTNLIDKTTLLTALAASIGLLLCILKIKTHEDEIPEVVEAPEVKAEVSAEFKPGKFVSSKTGSTYHAPTCDWAKKIKEQNQVWFDNEKEAKKKYKAHSCLKK